MTATYNNELTSNYSYAEKSADELAATDLRLEAESLKAQGIEFETYGFGTVEFNGEVLYVPSANRAGVFAGADSQWTDAHSIEEAIERYLTDSMIN